MIINSETVSTRKEWLYNFFKNKNIGIPIFQRFYDWKAQYTKQLLIDIDNAILNPDSELYLLDFIYYIENGKIMLADGQQRIVTINNLILAILDIAKEENIEIEPIHLFRISYDIPSNNKKYEQSFTKNSVAPFKNVYMHFREYIKENIDKINDIINIIKNKIYIFVKECKDSNDAFTIFQQINTGSKPLSKDEIIKTAIDQYSEMYDITVDTKGIKDLRQCITSYYKFVKDNPGADFDNIAIITFLKGTVTKDKKHFQKFADTVKTLKTLENNPFTSIFSWIQRTSLTDVLNILAMKNIDIFNKREYLNNVVFPLTMTSIVLSMKRGLPSTLKYLVNDVIRMIKTDCNSESINNYICKYIDDNELKFKITFDDFEKFIGEKQYEGIKKTLLILDIISRNVSGTINISQINLEHVYPKVPNIEWSQHNWPTSKEEQSKYIHNIGNYLILNEEVNKTIKNKYITYKKDYIQKVIKNDHVLQTETNTLDLDKIENIGKGYIIERQKQLAIMLRNGLPFGQKLILPKGAEL